MNGIAIQLALGGLNKASDKKLAERYKKKFMPEPESTSMNQTGLGSEAEDEMVILGTGMPNGGPRNPASDEIQSELDALSQLDGGSDASILTGASPEDVEVGGDVDDEENNLVKTALRKKLGM